MDPQSDQFAQLLDRLSQFDARRLDVVKAVIDGLDRLGERVEGNERQSDAGPSHFMATQESHILNSEAPKDWPRAPTHQLDGKGAYIVTGGTLHKEHHFRAAEALDFLEAELLRKARAYGWQLEAWAVFSNHYHFVGQALEDAESLRPMLNHLHSDTARWINEQDNKAERQVWYNFWETKLTYSKSYQARLHYVHRNAVHHGLVSVPNQYTWCSAGWFERTATPAQVKTIYSFKTNTLKVIDDFEPVLVVR